MLINRQPWRALKLALYEALPAQHKFWWLGGFGVYIAAAFLLIWFMGFSSIPEDRTPLYYLLSAQIQALGAILALVFTLSMVAAQLATNYSRRLFLMVFGEWVLVYLVIYLFGAGVPLFLLTGHFFLWSVRLSFLLGAACLFLLVPYFVLLRHRLSIQNIVASVERRAIEQYSTALDQIEDSGIQIDRSALPRDVETLDEIAMGALQAHDLGTFRTAMVALGNVGVFLGRDSRLVSTEEKGGLVYPLLERMRLIADRPLVREDPAAPIQVIETLRRIAEAVVDKDIEFLNSVVAVSLKRISEGGNERNMSDTAKAAAQALGTVGVNSIARGGKAARYCISSLTDLAKLQGDVASTSVHYLTQIGLLSVPHEDLKRTVTLKVVSSLGELSRSAAEQQADADPTTRSLVEIGKSALQHRQGDLVDRVEEELCDICEVAVQHDATDFASDVAEFLGELSVATAQLQLEVRQSFFGHSHWVETGFVGHGSHLVQAGKVAIQNEKTKVAASKFAIYLGHMGRIAFEKTLDSSARGSACGLWWMGARSWLTEPEGSLCQEVSDGLKRIETHPEALSIIDGGYDDTQSAMASNSEDELLDHLCKFRDWHKARITPLDSLPAVPGILAHEFLVEGEGILRQVELGAHHDANGALEAYTMALALDPEFIEARSGRGAVLVGLGHYKEGLQEIEEVLTRRPGDAQAMYNKACALSLLGEARALDCLEQALKNGPWRRDEAQKDSHFDFLRNHPELDSRFRELVEN